MNNFHPRSWRTASPRTVISSKDMRIAFQNGPLMQDGMFGITAARRETFPNRCLYHSGDNNVLFDNFELLDNPTDYRRRFLLILCV